MLPRRLLAPLSLVAASVAVPAVVTPGGTPPRPAVLAATATAPSRTAVVHSFDGTPIVVHFFPGDGASRSHREPTVLLGPGWSESGDTSPSTPTLDALGTIGTAPLLQHGYNVLTWDPRGFGGSGGEAHVDGPDYEARDVSVLVSWVARQPEAMLDRRGDPRVGMAGGSYGGGIQLVSAALDHRIDVITPDIAWHSLVSSLDKAGAVKAGWAGVLCGSGEVAGLVPGLVSPAGPQTGSVDPRVTTACEDGVENGTVPASILRWFASRGPGALVGRITAPTLLLQGTADTLFTLHEAIENYRILHAHAVPVKMLWFCGGHGICRTDAGPAGHIQTAVLAWLDRWLKRRPAIRTGPAFEYVDDTGTWRGAAAYPLAVLRRLVGEASGELAFSPADTAQGLAIAATPAADAANLLVAAPARDCEVVGEPALRLTYSGTGTAASTHVYAQLVDTASGTVLGNQVTPIRVALDGKPHTVRLPLEAVAVRVPAGDHLVLQLTGDSNVYTQQRVAGLLHVLDVRVSLPVVAPGRGLDPSRA